VNCPLCRQDSRVLKSIEGERRRECTACKHRFTTTEVLKEERLREQEAVQVVIEAAEKLRAAA
jgi:transcriptional regulator NrdR family protein